MFKLGESEISHVQTFVMLKSSICMGAIGNHSLSRKNGSFLLTQVHVKGRERKCRIVTGVNWKKTALQRINVWTVLLPCTVSGGKRSFLFRAASLCFSSVLEPDQSFMRCTPIIWFKDYVKHGHVYASEESQGLTVSRNVLTGLSYVVVGVEKKVFHLLLCGTFFCANTRQNSRVLLPSPTPTPP